MRGFRRVRRRARGRALQVAGEQAPDEQVAEAVRVVEAETLGIALEEIVERGWAASPAVAPTGRRLARARHRRRCVGRAFRHARRVARTRVRGTGGRLRGRYRISRARPGFAPRLAYYGLERSWYAALGEQEE